ncbi:hypothetical protein OAH59_00150 [Euryarchaeota archaeon]|nr:hypothetical protein [Euryarchaeota archaeon]
MSTLTSVNKRSKISISIVFLLVFSSFSSVFIETEVNLNPINQTYYSSNNTIDSNTSDFLSGALGISPQASVNGIIDDSNNIHLVWRNNSIDDIDDGPKLDIDYNGIIHIITSNQMVPNLNYAMIGSNNTLLIAPTEMSSNLSIGITYLVLDPDFDNQDGSSADVTDILVAQPVNWNIGNSMSPDISVDSFNAAHITWITDTDPSGALYNSDQIYYAMYAYDNSSNTISPIIGHTSITQSLSDSGSPSISVNSNNTVVIVWQDTSFSTIEFVAPLDTSGSMNAEWADMCAVFYGGSFASGYNFEGLKPMLEDSNITVYETLYALSGNWPSAATSGNCAAAYSTGGSGNQGPRTTALGLQPNDDSGGIRELTEVVYSNGAIDLPTDGGYYSEFWGPASTWACLSWHDNQGNVPGNPPTVLDHNWNPNATKFVIPVSDEGPYGGDPAGDSDDTQSILEAHNACVTAGIIPIPLMAAGFGSGSTEVGSHMMDLAQCPNGFTSLNSRTCDGSTLALTDAEGTMYTFPTGSSNQAEMQLMVEALVDIAGSSGSTEILLTVLDPYSFFNNPRNGWYLGDSANWEQPDGSYGEYVGPAIDGAGYGNFVLADDIRLTNSIEYSINPDVKIDDMGNAHIVWSDGRNNITDIDGPNQVHYMQIDIFRNGDLQGELDLNETITVSDSSLSESNLTYGQNPKLDLDTDNSIYISWFESDSSQSRLITSRLQSPQGRPDGSLFLHSDLYQAYGEISTEIISPDSQIINTPITGFNYPERIILWFEDDDCGQSNTGWLENQEDQMIEVCIYKNSDYTIEIIETLDEYIILSPNERRIIDMTIISNKIPGGQDTILLSHSTIPDYWLLSFGHISTNQNSISLIPESHSFVTLDLKSPNLYNINSNESFDLELYYYSTSFSTNILIQYLNISVVNNGDWNDDDGDGVLDMNDLCQWGQSDWISTISSDYDNDGCKDSTEDLNDDQDPFLDVEDACPKGQSWWDNISIDYDQDGCVDNEDPDDDNDGIIDIDDLCQWGQSDWISNYTTDYDGDGCDDSTEDSNDDQDPFLDVEDACPKGQSWWDNISIDYDQDGCLDNEDIDDDNDGILDVDDNCRVSTILQSGLEDYDDDGCYNYEDLDDDNDGILDSVDQCILGISNIQSTIFNDWDVDGCLDSEDSDDDNDEVEDIIDMCVKSFSIDPFIDLDIDGCNDLVEDYDLDNDGIITSDDSCESSIDLAWVSNIFEDQDSDGCRDSTEDLDDDNDGILDFEDECKTTPPELIFDYDNDGCANEEDIDDDNDGILDVNDNCERGSMGWQSNTENDVDSDGCNDLLEDNSLPSKLLSRNILVAISIAIIAIFCLSIYLSPKSKFSNIYLSKHNKSELSDKNIIDDFDLDTLLDMANGLDQDSSNGGLSTEPLVSTKTSVKTSKIISNKEELPEIPSPPELSQKPGIDKIKDQIMEEILHPMPIESISGKVMKKNIEILNLSDLISSAVNLNDPIEWLQMAEKLSNSGNLEDAIICKNKALQILQNSD